MLSGSGLFGYLGCSGFGLIWLGLVGYCYFMWLLLLSFGYCNLAVLSYFGRGLIWLFGLLRVLGSLILGSGDLLTI